MSGTEVFKITYRLSGAEIREWVTGIRQLCKKLDWLKENLGIEKPTVTIHPPGFGWGSEIRL